MFKPYTSNSDSGEFYLVGKGFLGVSNSVIEKLYNILDKFKPNQAIFPKTSIPETFILQINSFIENMTNLNIMGIEKTNLLLTCKKHSSDIHIQKTLKCDKFINIKNMENILIPN